MNNPFISAKQEDFDKAFEHFHKELGALRAGRANSAMIEDILVDCYGVKTPLKQLGSIGIPEPRVMTIEPWDKSILKEIEKALSYANTGLGVSVEAALVRVTVPQMTEETRRALVKVLNEKLEEAKISVRSVREDIKESIITAERNKEIPEDDRYAYIEELDKKVVEMNKQLQTIAEKKENEVMTV